MGTDTFFVTTAIDYVNDVPHLGTAYEKIAADAIARYRRLRGDDTYFLMGNDEHSTNVEKAASAKGMDPQQYCDMMAETFQTTWKKLNISYNGFIRTTEPRHIRAVQKMFSRIHEKGDIYAGTYEGLYCVSCEAFYTEKDLVDGKCPTHKVEPKRISEENHFFRLSKYQDALLRHIEEHPEFIVPEIRRNEILNVIKSGLEDVSVSRAGSRWGIPLPNDPTQTIYVWFDALINYVSALGFADAGGAKTEAGSPGDAGGLADSRPVAAESAEGSLFARYWPARLHVIGKDITRFHCVLWPAMLMSAGVELPATVLGHGFVSFKGERMSKSLGNIVNPLEVADKFGPDPLRYYLLREVPLDRDGDFSWELFIERYNSDLANDLGNLVSRTLAMVVRYNAGRVADTLVISEKIGQLREAVRACVAEYPRLMDRYEVSAAVQSAWKLIRRANQFIEETAPWQLAKDPSRKTELLSVLNALLEAIRVIAVVLFPIMPAKSVEIWALAGYPGSPHMNRIGSLGWSDAVTGPGRVLRQPTPLFPRIST
ncbi:MAG: class I tRNA ligase family protein [Candidatus Eisenbacteria bacterium]|nr:class I tRNA ligase family protein [Candidatus Eisenbacteria bacterium]